MSETVRVRFAPSPTGALHIGGVRTALYNYFFARQHKGQFILRIEDTDSSRFVAGAETYIVESLRWLGIEIDEGIGAVDEQEGDAAPYRQSERKDIYKKYVDQLLAQDLAYIAFDTAHELDTMRSKTPNFQYDATTRNQMQNSLTLSPQEVDRRLSEGMQYVVRIKINPGQDIVVDDLIRGKVTISSSILDDKVLYKSSDGLPTYHLANIVDDHLMRISHVIRGEEWLPSAPLHVLLYQYFGWSDTMPQFAHLPLLLKPDGNGKLSKRDGERLGFPVFPLNWEDPKTGNISVGYREDGYLPEAVVNFLSLLGWNPGTEQELFSMNELIDAFSLDHVSKSGAKFNYEKCKWFNHNYIQQKSDKELAEILQHILVEKDIFEDSDKLINIIALIKERIYLTTDLWEQTHFFFETPMSYNEKNVKKHWKQDTSNQLLELATLLEELTDFSATHQEETVKQWIINNSYSMGKIFNPLRIALVGASAGPHLFDITEIIGKEETIHRIYQAINKIDNTQEA